MTYTTLIEFAKPSEFAPDALTDVLRRGARELLATAVQAEVAEFLAAHADVLDDEGRQRLVRHGSLPGREVMTGIGKVAVQVPRVRDRGADKDGSRIRFRSSLIPPYLRKSKSVVNPGAKFPTIPERNWSVWRRLGACASHIADARQGALAVGQ